MTADRVRSTSRPLRLRDSHPISVEEGIGAGVGLVAGGVAGAIAGPIGIAIGASIGAVVGDAVGNVMHEREARASKHDHELDEAIGVTSGSLGARPALGCRDAGKLVLALHAEHDHLRQLAASVIDAFEAGDRSDAADAITSMQMNVLDHLEHEERALMPAYARHAPDDARAILEDHAAIRKALAELDVTNDLHLLRIHAVKAFLELLRAHTDRESIGLYRWAEAQ